MARLLPHIDLHYLSWEKAQRCADRELNQAFCQEEAERFLTFITGRGGVLGPQLQEFLLQHPLVESIELSGPRIKAYLHPYKE